jgi:hypothetical protein
MTLETDLNSKLMIICCEKSAYSNGEQKLFHFLRAFGFPSAGDEMVR